MIRFHQDVIVVSTSRTPEMKKFLGKTGRACYNTAPNSRRQYPYLVTFTDSKLGSEIFKSSEIENL